MNKAGLIIFTRHPELGKCKTRIAAELGDHAALKIYEKLVAYTHAITKDLPMKKFVFYADDLPPVDLWTDGNFERRIQTPGGLGEKMLNAFKEVFESGCDQVAIIGSDCAQITAMDILSAYTPLEDVVFGPAEDGGYYLLRLSHCIPELFQDMKWSHHQVLEKSLSRLGELGIDYYLLGTKSDIDYANDLQKPGYVIF
jgi:uncharacterized protein